MVGVHARSHFSIAWVTRILSNFLCVILVILWANLEALLLVPAMPGKVDAPYAESNGIAKPGGLLGPAISTLSRQSAASREPRFRRHHRTSGSSRQPQHWWCALISRRLRNTTSPGLIAWLAHGKDMPI